MNSNYHPAVSLSCRVIQLFALIGCSALVLAQTTGNWPGEYTSPHGVDLTLEAGAGNAVGGQLSVENNGSKQSFSVDLKPAGNGLRGTFSDGTSNYPIEISLGEERGQIVLVSEGAMYELERKGGAQNPVLGGGPTNPLLGANTGTAPAPQATAGDGNFHHPDGYFSMTVPSNWEANMMSGDVFELLTGVPGDLVIVVLGDLESFEIGKPAVDVMPSAMDIMDEFLAQNAGINPDTARANTQAVRAGRHSAARSERPATDQGRRATVWQGLVVHEANALILLSSVSAERRAQLIPVLDDAIASVSINRTWRPGEFSQSYSGTGGNASGRNVVVNGQRIDDATLTRLEGPVPVIPDGEYWYDNTSGMVGMAGGPTEAYLAAGLNLGGDLSPYASGGGTQVAFNGRYLHPIDLAGLEYYFGAIAPGRFWINDRGDYGREGGPKEGNLIEEIAAVNMMAASMQAQMQQQLQQQVQMYGGQGGYYGQGGGYYDQGGYGGGGGSVYQHFPNLGAGGSSTSVANLGGGDSIVNAGGVLWWPGK